MKKPLPRALDILTVLLNALIIGLAVLALGIQVLWLQN
jgi:hypothetical protein